LWAKVETKGPPEKSGTMDPGTAVGWSDFESELGGVLHAMQDNFASLLLRPWGLFQLILLVAIVVAAHFLAVRAEPRLEAWLRGLETTRQRLRASAILLRRLRLVFFVIGAWAAVVVLRATTWPSHSYWISVVASLATVWLAVSLIGRLVRNRLARRILTVAVWIVAALQILGALPTAITILDAVSISAGSLRISLLLVIKASLVLALLLWGASLLSNFTERRVQQLEDITPSMRVLAGKLVRIGLFTIAMVVALQSMGLDLTGLTVFSGAVGLGLGFGLQKVVSNLISGVILLIDKSIKPGDVIEVGETFGWITTLGGRYVSVVTRDGREYLIPNEDLITNQVINWSHSDPKVRLEVPFGVDYSADPHLVRKLAIEAANRSKRVLGVPQPVCHLTGFGESSIDFVLRFWIADPSGGVVNIKGEVLLALWDVLAENGVAIPYPHRDIKIREPIHVSLSNESAGVGAASANQSPSARPNRSRTKTPRKDDDLSP
jgi:small-conductance mechanosensitive channel